MLFIKKPSLILFTPKLQACKGTTMKKIIFLITLLASTNSIANELRNFNAIKAAAKTGKNIHIIIDFEKCSSPNNIQISTTAVFTPDAMLIANNRIITSLMHFTLNNPTYPGKPVYEFVKYTIADDNTVQVISQTLDAVNYAPLGNINTFNCSVDSSAQFYD